MDKMYNFFISSTWKDLKDERKAVIDCVLETHNHPIAMELFNSNSFSQWEHIKKEIDSSDYYILILGGKYGSITQNDQISYTEKEFDYAFQKGIPIMAFVIEDTNKLSYDKNESEKFRRKLLENFRNKVTSGLLVNFYTDKNDLKYKVCLAIHSIVEEKPRSGWIRLDSITEPVAQQELSGDISRSSYSTSVKSSDVTTEQNISSLKINTDTLNSDVSLSEIAERILIEASEDSQGEIIIKKTLAGNNIQTNNKSLMPNGTHREYIESLDAKFGLLTEVGKNGEVFQLNKGGYNAADFLLQRQRKEETKPLDYASLPNIEVEDFDSLTNDLGHTQNGLSTKQITRLFDACCIKDVSPSLGKSNRLYDAFKAEQKTSKSSCSIWKFIEKALITIRGSGNEAQYKILHKKISNVINKYDVYANNEGNLT